ncbi:AT-hook motif nuclear-localized protein 19-like [Vigna unguiculata]|uniref:PPC domain-containing protein n=1 Tax=Vigna unguiculata TaxID=3917 RepID=A0A4D6KZ78_VIGUN|nr:AT-hook motif nuclear-localized protein 19-like [Vigna unguiculata]QCD79344.1 hypothetical protein DEO72_LG1g2983 [Vigna unguiculata]
MRNNSPKIYDLDSTSSQDEDTNSSFQQGQPQEATAANEPRTTKSGRRPRGRPVGSRNKPKPSSLRVPETTDSTMNVFTFNVAPNGDIMESILEIVHRDQVSVTVMNVSGMINNVTMEASNEGSPPIMLYGPFNFLSLTGSYLYDNHYILHPGATPPPPPSFGIHLSTAQGQVFSGIIGGRVIAGENVMITVSTFRNPDILKYTPEDRQEDELDNNTDNNSPGGFCGGGDFMGFNPSSGIPGFG